MDEQNRPTGTVTFLFSDIEGSTELAAALGPSGYREILELHQRLLREAFARHDGIERGTEGDSFFVVFRHAPAAVAAAVDGLRSLAAQAWPAGVTVRAALDADSYDEAWRRGLEMSVDEIMAYTLELASAQAGSAPGAMGPPASPGPP